tara:strand:+ start:476 stop:706 length:231 start_codon:yes stop_codon:yes gene_type:complete
MFKIFAAICFINIGEFDQTLCFRSEVPTTFQDFTECNFAVDNIVSYMHEDLQEREVSIVFKCQTLMEQTYATTNTE